MVGPAAVARLNAFGDDSASSYLVVVCNRSGAGVAEAVKATFDTGGGHVYNEAGNWPGPDLNTSVTPPRYHDASRVLNPGDERPIALLVWDHHSGRPTGPLRWTVRAKDMPVHAGEETVNVSLPPSPYEG